MNCLLLATASSAGTVTSWMTVGGIWMLCFLIGSIPFGYVIGTLRGIDLRKEGSGNIGATNAFRILGKGWGFLVLFLDMAKALVPLLLLRWAVQGPWSGTLPLSQDLFLIVAGVLIVCGHNFSPFLAFKGGKGMASAGGFLLALMPGSFLLCLGSWLLLAFTTRYVSLASIVAAACLPLGAFLFHRNSMTYLIFSFLLAAMNIWKHRSNIRRLLDGTEHRMGDVKKDPPAA